MRKPDPFYLVEVQHAGKRVCLTLERTFTFKEEKIRTKRKFLKCIQIPIILTLFSSKAIFRS
eukprot:Gb_16718 [translate_table: standard]